MAPASSSRLPARSPTPQRQQPMGSRPRHRSSTSPARSSAPKQPQHQLSAAALLDFERRGCLITPLLLPPSQLDPVRQCVQEVTTAEAHRLQSLKHRIRVLCPPEVSARLDAITSSSEALQLISAHGAELGFLQFFNLHRTHPVISSLVRDPRLARIAAQLLGVSRLRLYQDCVFLKEPGFAETNWHSDLRMAPLDTNAFITAWLPLRPVQGGERDSGLVFALGSHRDFALPFWHDLQGRDLSDRGYEIDDTGPMAVGDVSWHHGWLLHAGAPQPPGTQKRLAIAVSFFADGARVLARKSDPSVLADNLHDEDAESYQPWLSQVKDGGLARHALLPLVL